MNLVPMADILKDAYANGYGIGGFNINNMEFLQGIIWAAEEEKISIDITGKVRSDILVWIML